MEDPARMIGQPFPDLWVLVGGGVVGDGVDDLARRNGPLDGVEELDEFLEGCWACSDRSRCRPGH